MEKTKIKWRNPRAAIDAESVLEGYYSQLLKWGALLTRGDMGMAQEIVHDLYLHFALAKPDLSQVANLNGYLYTCLRNIYLSALARSSREATQFVSVADFDSIHFALSSGSSGGLLQRQNDLRRICSYAVWRKESSKSASYLILLFFHGYSRREVAEIACLPIAAIYNKLKIARMEVKAYLEDSGKLRIASRDIPPEPELRLSPVSSVELFSEFRETILRARDSECLPEEALLAHYRSANPKPIPCSLLSHIVSCEHCLALIDRHFQRPTLEDREPPEDFGGPVDRKAAGAATHDKSYRAMMRAVAKQKDRVYEHRPRTLSIAVNGRITAYHDVQSERSTLSSRIEHLGSAHFVEVFAEQQVRLALLPVDELPPEGPHTHSQRVALSDDRWLELVLSFDGQGLHSEVTYFDPALAMAMGQEDMNEELPAIAARTNPESLSIPGAPAKAISIFGGFARYFRALAPRSAVAWAVVVACIVCAAGFFAYRYGRAPLDANEILNRSVAIETADLKGETEHQVLRLEEAAADGRVTRQGTIDLWKEGNGGRTMRRLYNGQQRLIAAEWRAKDGKAGSYAVASGSSLSDADRALAASALWKQDMSANSFRALAGQRVRVRTLDENYELTGAGMAEGELHLVSAVLVLDHHLRPVSEILRVHSGSAIHEVRLVQANYERRPASSVPDSVFDPANLEMDSQTHQGSSSGSLQYNLPGAMGTDVRLVQTQIAVLYQLSKLGADTSEPIQVSRTRDGRIRISGTVADNARKQEISAALEALPDHELLEIRLASQRDLRMPVPSVQRALPPAAGVYNVAQTQAPADAVLRRYFGARGWTGERVNSAVAQFSRDALGHAQRALQHAYALDRLGSTFTAGELQSVSPASERQWAEMAARHAASLESELQELDAQLAQIAPGDGQSPHTEGVQIQIDNPAGFAHAASQLLRQAQILNRSIGSAFASGSSGMATQNPDAAVANAAHSIPLRSAREIAGFASRLADPEAAANRQKRSAGQR